MKDLLTLDKVYHAAFVLKDVIRDTGMSKDRFYRHMKPLEEKGIVKKHYVKTGPGNFDRKLIYQLCDFKD